MNCTTYIQLIIAICTTPCGAYQQCTAPNTCTCISGWTMNGTNCIRKQLLVFKLILSLAICTTLCGAYQQCTAPNTCTCISGWTMNGTECIGIINSPYVYINNT